MRLPAQWQTCVAQQDGFIFYPSTVITVLFVFERSDTSESCNLNSIVFLPIGASKSRSIRISPCQTRTILVFLYMNIGITNVAYTGYRRYLTQHPATQGRGQRSRVTVQNCFTSEPPFDGQSTNKLSILSCPQISTCTHLHCPRGIPMPTSGRVAFPSLQPHVETPSVNPTENRCKTFLS
jgi:hypothetical protein